MSEFDKEAEREKLRQKYGDSDEDETTAQMSELLLQGATMTNRHCETCGNPLFRKDGQEFCPHCDLEEGQIQTEPEPDPDPQPATTAKSEPSQPTAELEQTHTSDLTAGQQALIEALTTHARRGANADDPRRAKEHLEVAHEAAATLTELRVENRS